MSGRADAQGRPLRPYSAAIQRRALDIIAERLFGDDDYVVDAEFLGKLQSNLLYDWNYPYRSGNDYIYETRLTYLYGTTLSTILDGARLARVKDNESRYGPGEEVFLLPDLFDRLSDAVFDALEAGNFSTTSGAAPLVASKRRALHRIYTGLLADLVLSPAAGTPADASMLAAAELRKIRERVRASLESPTLDGYGRAHLEDLDTRVGRVLDAEIGLPAQGG